MPVRCCNNTHSERGNRRSPRSNCCEKKKEALTHTLKEAIDALHTPQRKPLTLQLASPALPPLICPLPHLLVDFLGFFPPFFCSPPCTRGRACAETRDLCRVIRYARARFANEKLVLMGTSTGAVACFLSLATDSFARDNVVCFVAGLPLSRPRPQCP